jgi:hypothetical protein
MKKLIVSALALVLWAVPARAQFAPLLVTEDPVSALSAATAAIQAAVEDLVSTGINIVAVGGAAPLADITFDCDTGAGTQTCPGVPIAFAASGGAVLAPGTAADGMLVNLGTNNDVTLAALPALVAGTASIGAVTGANSLPIVACDQEYTGAPSADAVMIAAGGGATKVRICSIHIDAEATVDTRIITGTGTACGTSTRQLSPMYAFSTTTGFIGTNEGSGLGAIMTGDANEDVCIDVSGAVVNNVRVTYAIF